MAWALSALVAGVWLLQQLARLPGWGELAAAAAAAALAAALAVPSRRRRWARAAGVAVCLASLLAGFVYAAVAAHLRLADELAFADEGHDVRVVGVVADLPALSERGSRFGFEIERVLADGDSTVPHVPRRVTLAWYDPQIHPLPAQRWELTVRLRRPHGALNPAGFDVEGWMLEQGVRATGYVRDGARDQAPRLVDARVLQFNPLVDRVRDRLRERLQQLLADRRYGGVIVALVMGDQGLIRQSDWTLFNGTGISHLVSISGLHITMIAALTALVAGAAWRRSPSLLRMASVPVARAVAGMVGALAYCLLAGWGVPAQRTFLMLATVAVALCWRVGLSAPTILASAAALVCLWDPWAVLAAGFWLSFGAVACIFLAMSGRTRVPAGWRHGLREGLRVQGAITVGQVPLTLAIFGQVSLVAPLANAIAIPLVSYAVTPLALIGAALSAFGETGGAAARPLLALSETLFGWLAGWLEWLATAPLAWFALPAPPAWTILAAAAGVAWLLAPPGWPLRWLGIAWMLPMLVWPADRPRTGELWVTALDVGQGMGVVLETSDRTVVFDTGPRFGDDADAGMRVMGPYLRSRGIGRIDLLVVSHLDADHSGGAASLLQAFPVSQVLTSIDAGDRSVAGKAPVRRCEAGQAFGIGELQLRVLNPPAELYQARRATTNAKSCVVAVQLAGASVLLTGDVPAREEGGIVERFGPLPATLMLAPHHGSRSSSSERFLDAVRPAWISIQVGYRSRYGHPHAIVLDRYRSRGLRIVRSDFDGAARWRFDAEGGTTLERWRRDHAAYWHNQPGVWAARLGEGGVPGAEGNGDAAQEGGGEGAKNEP
jgi:competence protein ComEC